MRLMDDDDDDCLPRWLSGSNCWATVCSACMAVRLQRSRVQIPGPVVCWFVQANLCIFRD